ncbi:CHAP domain-containing protein [Commensalibacter oyaizuii]|uniref:CHAP domain-containing protein n=1 Tax=Commensalibacter oyaizuii TaxID=3043873 RepID=A0ABT6Q173_9PROT|nr:CHAP domain-containing protein [Commensalibacter sp. TBRC 16381]MDI2090852.1 CHAP domain-containing protein [Commensalibacter sp. TBRC 16381]
MKKVFMQNNKKIKFASFLLMFSCMSGVTHYAHARSTHHGQKKSVSHAKKASHGAAAHKVSFKTSSHASKKQRNHYKTKRLRYAHRSGGGRVIQCVAFARSATEVQLRGNAGTWWNKAEGIYSRGNTPKPNSVLSFRSTRRMPYGHVAVVRQIVDSRTIIIDQSHWAQRGISRNTPVIDVSPNNDWTAVRVAMNGNKNAFGSIYPTHGFIYPSNDDSGEIRNASTKRNYPQQLRTKTWSADAATARGYSKVNTQVALAPNVSDDFFVNDAPNRFLK